MKVSVNIEPDLAEEVVTFRLRRMNPQLDRIIQDLTAMEIQLIGRRGEVRYRLNPADLTTIYALDKKVYTVSDQEEEYQLKETLSSLVDKLPGEFLRISNSEIVHGGKIKSFEFTLGGKLKINFKNGNWTYSSRSYLKKIKEYFGL